MQKETSLIISEGGNCQSVAVSGASSSSAIISHSELLIYATVDCFARIGSAPVALATGVDQFIPANTMLRIPMRPGWKIAFITTGATGTVYITPGA